MLDVTFFGINFSWFIPTILIYFIGLFFDQAFSQIKNKTFGKYYLLHSWIAHDIAMIGEIYTYLQFMGDNPTYKILLPLGVISWVFGTFVMGYLQHKRNPALPISFFGDGLGNTPEFVFDQTTNLFNYVFNSKMPMSTMSFYLRILMVVLSFLIFI